MTTYVIELTDTQREAVIAALGDRADGCLDRIRQSTDSGILTADELKEQVNLELHWLRSTLAALTLLAPNAADRRLEQLTRLMVDYRRELHELRESEREMHEWNARARALQALEAKKKAATGTVTA